MSVAPAKSSANKLPKRPARATASAVSSATKSGKSLPRAAAVRARRVETALFSDLVKAGPLAGQPAISAIRKGYSALILKAASSYFDVPDARIQAIAQVPASTASRLEKKQARIDPAASERVYRMGTITRMAIEVFESEPTAIAWMRQPNRALASAAPLELMDTEPGAVSVRQVLNAIATGGAA